MMWIVLLIIADLVVVGVLVIGADKVMNNPLDLVRIFLEPELFKQFASYQGLYIFFVAIVFGYHQGSSRSSYNNTIHGSAKWSNMVEIRKVLNPEKGIILGKKLCLDMDSPLNKNVMIIGSSGTGKSRGFIKPNVLQMNGSYIITDPKGEIFDHTSDYLKSNGYGVKVLNLVNLNASDSYNPLAYINSQQDIQVLAKTIIDNTSKGVLNVGEDSFWANSEMALLTALITYVLYELPEKQRNLSSVLNLLLTASKGDKLDELFFKLPDSHKALTSYKIFCLSGDPKTRGNIMIGLGVRLQALQNEAVSRLTASDTLDLGLTGRNKTAVYVITSDSHRTYDFISSMFFSQIFQTLYCEADKNEGRLNIPVICLLDEFSNIGRIPDFSSKVASMRPRGISVSIVVQSLGQLKARYEKEWSDIMGNCDSLLFLGTQDIETAKFISERLGKSTVTSKTKSLSVPFRSSVRGSKTEGEGKTGRPLLMPDEITRLEPRKSIIIIQGLYPVMANKYDITYHKDYSKLRKRNHNEYNSNYIPVYEEFKPVFDEDEAPKEQMKTFTKTKADIKREQTKEAEFFQDNTSIFENTDFGRCRNESREIS